MRDLDRMRTRAWEELAVGEKGFTNVKTDEGTMSAVLSSVGTTAPKEPMKDLTSCILQSVYEEYEPHLKKVDRSPDYTRPLSFVFVKDPITGIGTVLIPHLLLRIPRGWHILHQSSPATVYATPLNRQLWTPVTIVLSAHFPSDVLDNTCVGELVLL